MRRIAQLFGLVFIAAMTVLSCSSEKISVNITQYTDMTSISGITEYEGDIYCATNGGLLKWNIQEKEYTFFTTSDGLVSNVLKDITVDRENRLWVSTVEGMSMYDGTYWNNYTVAQGLPSELVNDISLDIDGNLWVATGEGVAFFDGKSFTLFDDPGGPGSQSTVCVYFDSGNNIWIGTGDDGIYFKTGEIWNRSTVEDGLLIDTATTIIQSWDRRVWVATWCGFNWWSGTMWNPFPALDQIGTFDARFLDSSDERLWYFTANGVHSSRGKEWLRFTEEQGLMSNDVLSGMVVSDDLVYVGTSQGLSIIRNNEIENYYIPNSIIGHNCISLSVDDQSRVWVGTWETGLNLFDSGYWTKPVLVDEDFFLTIRSMVFGNEDEMAFNTKSGVIFKNGKNIKKHNRFNGLPSDDIRCGVYDDQGRYWAGSVTGISYLDNNRWRRIRESNGLPSEDVWSCALDSNGTLWFGTTEGIVTIYDDILTDMTPEIDLEEVDVRAIVADDSRVYFGTESGKLLIYENESWEIIGNRFLDTASGISSIAINDDGVLWLGTNGNGVIRYDGDSASRYTVKDGLPSNYVRSLAFDDETLWMACFGGVAKLTMSESSE